MESPDDKKQLPAPLGSTLSTSGDAKLKKFDAGVVPLSSTYLKMGQDTYAISKNLKPVLDWQKANAGTVTKLVDMTRAAQKASELVRPEFVALNNYVTQVYDFTASSQGTLNRLMEPASKLMQIHGDPSMKSIRALAKMTENSKVLDAWNAVKPSFNIRSNSMATNVGMIEPVWDLAKMQASPSLIGLIPANPNRPFKAEDHTVLTNFAISAAEMLNEYNFATISSINWTTTAVANGLIKQEMEQASTLAKALKEQENVGVVKDLDWAIDEYVEVSKGIAKRLPEADSINAYEYGSVVYGTIENICGLHEQKLLRIGGLLDDVANFFYGSVETLPDEYRDTVTNIRLRVKNCWDIVFSIKKSFTAQSPIEADSIKNFWGLNAEIKDLFDTTRNWKNQVIASH